jgi:superfamily II RNA helicase
LGVGAHHSGQLPAWKLVLETLMTEGLLDAVFATSTVAAGVNFPARTVVFLNSDKFNGKEFLPLNPTEFHQMTGRAGRRGMDHIGFALSIPGKFMDVRLMARLVSSPPSDVFSQIRINFSMVLNLLLSHNPGQIRRLLEKSFATYQLVKRKGKPAIQDSDQNGSLHLWNDFLRHFDFLKQTGYVAEDDTLTDDGIWASQLRIDQPIMVAEGFRLGIFPDSDPASLAGIMTLFVNEQETDDRVDKRFSSENLSKSFQRVKRGLKPFSNLMAAEKFEVKPLFLRPATAVYAWAAGTSWEVVRSIAEVEDGNLVMMILRTADCLRHVSSLKHVFPAAAESADAAIQCILRDPVLID